MAKKLKAIVRLQLEAGKANPAPPVGPALASHGVNIMAFCKEYNARTSNRPGEVLPAEITIYTDGSFSCFKEYDDWGSITNDDKKLKYDVFIEKLGIRSDGSTYFTGLQEFLIKAGILDGQKLIEDAKERIEKYIEDCEVKERKEFERLKAKFQIEDGQ